MRNIPNEWKKRAYKDPEPLLRRLRELQHSGLLEGLPYKLTALRTNELSPYLEHRQAALFCYGMGQRLGTRVLFSMFERSDYDFVATYDRDGIQHFAPVQLKELVPPETIPAGPVPQLQDEISKLKKYADAEDLVVAFHINRNVTIDPRNIIFPTLKLGALWLFGGIDPAQRQWMLMGNLLQPDPVVTFFDHPQP